MSGHGFQVELSDPAERRSLQGWLERVPGVGEVRPVATLAQPGEQGTADVLTVLASGGGVVAVAIRTLPEFIRSRRSRLTLTVKVSGREYVLDAENGDAVVAELTKLLGD